MAKQTYEVIGLKKAKSAKTGRDCFTIWFMGEHSDYDKENGNVEGKTAFSEFTYTDFGIHPGDVVEIGYQKGFQDRATLSEITVVSMANNPFKEKVK